MYTAEEYRNLMIGIMKMAIHDAEEEWEKGKILGDEMHDTYNFGFVAGLKEAQRKLEVSEFLSNPEFKD